MKENCQRESLMYRNLLDILYKCYNSQNKNIDFFEKIKVAYFIMEINILFSKDNLSSSSKSNTLEKKLKSFENLLYKKYKFLIEICKEENYKFNLFCLVAPLFNKLSTEKHLFNCIDAEIFRNNINSIYLFIEKFPIRKIYSDNNDNNNNISMKINSNTNTKKSENTKTNKEEKEDLYLLSLNNIVINFFQNFSFFTYFQFLQSDLTKLFLSFSTETETEAETEANSLIKKNQNSTKIFFGNNKTNLLIFLEEIKLKFFDLSNFLFNFNKTFENFIENKKIF